MKDDLHDLKHLAWAVCRTSLLDVASQVAIAKSVDGSETQPTGIRQLLQMLSSTQCCKDSV